jgi:hypothetical protein
MSRLIAAVVQNKQVLTTSLGTRVHLTFQTIDGHHIIIRAPIEDGYLANIEPLDQVSFQRDRQGCHHLQRRFFSLLLKSAFNRKHLHSTDLLNKPT